MTRAQHARFDSQIDSSSNITYKIKIKPQALSDDKIICISDVKKEVSIFNHNRANEMCKLMKFGRIASSYSERT